MPKHKTNPSQCLPPSFCSPNLMPQKQLNLIHFNCLLNNKNKHNSAYEIWTFGVVEGLGGVKSGQKWKIRSGVLIGKSQCWKMEAFLPLMTRFKLLKRKVRPLWSQRLGHAEDKNDQAENQETWVLILALPLTWHEQRSHFIPLDPGFASIKWEQWAE